MFTLSYKGSFIHGYCDRDECKAQIGNRLFTCASLRAAQLLITRVNAALLID